MKKLLAPICFMMALSVVSQIRQNNNATLNELDFFIKTNNSKYDDTEGSRYLNEEFMPANIYGIEKIQFVRFNVVENTIEFRDNNNIIKSLSMSRDYRIRLMDGSNRQYETKSYLDANGKSKKTFFELLYKGEKFELYLKERIEYVPKKPSKSSYEPEVPAKFAKLKDKYYVFGLKSESSDLVEIPRKKKDFFKLFGERSKIIEKFAKKEKFKLDNPKHLAAIFNFYFAQ